MNIYYVNRNSKYKGPFDITGPHREHIIKVGDICLRDYIEGVAFLVVKSSENTWKACKQVGLGNNIGLSEQGNTLLFSYDGIHKRKGNVSLLKQLSDCYNEKVITDFFSNAIDILNYKEYLWDASILANLYSYSQEPKANGTATKLNAVSKNATYPSLFAKYLNKDLLELLTACLNDGYELKEAYYIIRQKDPKLFRTSMMKFLSDNPQGTIYDKTSIEKNAHKI